MIGTERLFSDRQRALVIRPRSRKIAPRIQQGAEIVEVASRVPMVGTEMFPGYSGGLPP
jgi:hypothetical protein